MSYGGNRNYGGGGGSRGYGGGSRSGFSGGGFGGPKPVEAGKEYDVQISEISRQGDGIARSVNEHGRNQPFFVEFIACDDGYVMPAVIFIGIRITVIQIRKSSVGPR